MSNDFTRVGKLFSLVSAYDDFIWQSPFYVSRMAHLTQEAEESPRLCRRRIVFWMG